MSKKMNTSAIVNELTGNSGFFPPKDAIKSSSDHSRDTVIPRNQYGKQPSNRDTAIPRHQESKLSNNRDAMTHIRQSVKEIGKEAATHRFTLTEKNALLGIVFHYKQQGIRTSENEITRIAINYLIDDFEKHQEHSFLADVLSAIHS